MNAAKGRFHPVCCGSALFSVKLKLTNPQQQHTAEDKQGSRETLEHIHVKTHNPFSSVKYGRFVSKRIVPSVSDGEGHDKAVVFDNLN